MRPETIDCGKGMDRVTGELAMVLALLAAAVMMFALNRPRMDAVGLLMLALLPLSGVIIVNEALKLPRGKLAAQVAHASVAALLAATVDARRRWIEDGMPKVVLRGESEQMLLELEAAAEDAGLPNALIRDAGHTVVAAGTITCLGLGPASIAAIDALTAELKLV